MADCVISSLVQHASARPRLEVFAAIKTQKTKLQLQTYATTLLVALAKTL
jgi:hypothetical protein